MNFNRREHHKNILDYMEGLSERWWSLPTSETFNYTLKLNSLGPRLLGNNGWKNFN